MIALICGRSKTLNKHFELNHFVFAIALRRSESRVHDRVSQQKSRRRQRSHNEAKLPSSVGQPEKRKQHCCLRVRFQSQVPDSSPPSPPDLLGPDPR
jgi:hypothetical protein